VPGERRRGRERGEGRGSSPWDPTISDNSPPDHLGQRGGREVDERERELLRGKPNERERGRVHGGVGVPGAPGHEWGQAGSGWAGSHRGPKTHSTHDH
jgi:hypothetical protein